MQSQDYWDNYWQQGFITSFANEIEGTYGGEIAKFWQTLFQSIDPNADVLDLCSGNGALPLLFLSCSPLLNIVATDLAKLDEKRLVASTKSQFTDANIQFKGRVDCTDLPFDNYQFDVITSQFGFEYASTKSVLQQAYNKLKPKGIFASIVHVHDSRFISQNKSSLDFLNALLSSEFLAVVAAYVANKDKQVEQGQSWQTLNVLAASLKDKNEGEYIQLNIDGFLSALSFHTPKGRGEQLMTLFGEDMRNYQQRLTELVKAAQSEDDLTLLIHEAQAFGFKQSMSQRLQDKTGILGHCLVFQK